MRMDEKGERREIEIGKRIKVGAGEEEGGDRS